METDVTKRIKKVLYNHNVLNKMSVYGCFEVTLRALGYSKNKDRVDFLTIDNSNIVRCYEIKVSKSDFHSKANLSFWGNYNYIVITKSLFTEIKNDEKFHVMQASGIGVVIIDGSNYLVSRKPTYKQVSFSQQAQIVESMMKSLSREFNKTMKRTLEH